MTRPVRALHVVNWLNRGGIETWLLQLLERADRRHLAMDVCCKGTNTGEMSGDARNTGAMVMHVPMGRFGPWSASFRRDLARALRDGEYDAVHSHIGDLSEPVLDAAIDAGIEHRVVMYHQVEHRFERRRLLRTPLVRWQRGVRRRIANKATAVVGCSESVLAAVYPGVHDGAFAILHPSVDTRRFDFDLVRRCDARRELGVDRDRIVIVNVGNVGYAKNQAAIIDVADALRRRGLSPLFVIVGTGPLFDALDADVRKRGLTDVVRLLGPRVDVPRWLNAADIAIHPSVAEGLPVSVLEYQASGLPVVGSNIGPVIEALAPQNRAYAARPDDVAAMVHAIQRLASAPDLRQALADAGRRWTEDRFSTERSLEALAALYA